MSKKSAGRMLMTEAIVIGIIGTVAGLCTGLLMMQSVPLAVGLFWGNVAIAAPKLKITVMCAAGIAAMLLGSLIPLIKGRNISITDNIRYE